MLGTQQNIITIIVVYLFIINIDWFSLGFFFYWFLILPLLNWNFGFVTISIYHSLNGLDFKTMD